MPKIAKEHTALEVKRLTEPGLHAVGTVAGLRLLVKPSGARSWVLRTMVGTRRAELGLGGYPTVSLAQAIEYAREALQGDPRWRRSGRASGERSATSSSGPSRKRPAPTSRRTGRAGRTPSTPTNGRTRSTTYAFPVFGHKHVRDVSKGDVLAAIEPIWATKNETATRVRNRIELVLNYAVQRELRPEGLNPARWRGNLDAALPKASKVAKVEHHAALAIDEMHDFMQRLRSAEGTGARALEFAILTAARSGEVRGATWPEIDLQAGVWNLARPIG